MDKLKNKRVRIDVRWTKKEPYIWDLYHYLVNWCDSYTKDSGYNSLTILKDFCSYTLLFYREWDESKQMTIICNNYHSEEFRKLKSLIRRYFKKYHPRFEKARDFDKEYNSKQPKTENAIPPTSKEAGILANFI